MTDNASDILKLLKETYDEANQSDVESKITEGYKTTKDGFIKMSSGGKDEESKLDKIERNNILKTYREQLSFAEEINEKESNHQKQLQQMMIKNFTYQKKAEQDFSSHRLNNLKELYELSHDEEAERIQILQDNLAEYYETALNENRELTEEELKNIQKIQDELDEVSNNAMKSSSSKWADAFSNAAKTFLKFISDSAKKITDIYYTNVIRDGISELSSAYESNFTEIAGRTGSDSRDANHNFIKGVLQEINAHSYTKEGLNFSTEVLPALTDAVKQGFMGEEAEKIAISNAIDKKIMPWLETSSETWVALQYQLSDDTLRQIKGQQLLLQETREGNRLLQTGVVGQLTNSLQPTLLNIETNTTDVTKLSSQAQATVAYLMDKGYGQNDAIKIANQMIDAYQNPAAALIDGGSPVEILMSQTALNGGDLVDIAKTYGDTAERAIGTDAVGMYAIFKTMGLNAGGITRDDEQAIDLSGLGDTPDYTNYLKDFSINQEEAQKKYLSEINGLREDVTATQAYDNALKNWTAETGFDMNKIAHGSDLQQEILNSMQDIKNYLIALLAEGLGNLISKGFGKLFGKGKPGGSLPGDVIPDEAASGGSMLSKLVTPTASAGAGGLSSAMSIPAVGFAGGAAGAGLAAYGYSEMSDYANEGRTGLAASAGTGATVGAVGGAMLAGGAVASMAGIGVANAWNPVGWGLLIASAVTLIATEIIDAATSIGGAARRVEAEYDAQKRRLKDQYLEQEETLADIHENLENNADLETQRAELINSGILSEADTETARIANRDGLQQLTMAYLQASGKISGEAEDILNEYKQKDKQAAEQIQKNFRSVADSYNDGNMTEGAREAMTMTFQRIHADLKKDAANYDSWSEETQDLYDNLEEAWSDGHFSNDEINMIIDEGWRNQSFVEASISPDALVSAYEAMLRSDNAEVQEFARKMNITKQFYGSERVAEMAELVAQAKNQLTVEGAQEYLDQLKAKGYTSAEFPEIGEVADKWGLEGYKLGSWYIPHDIIAQLHRGERVLTEGQNKEYTKEKLSGNTQSSIIQFSIQDVITAIKTQTEDIINYLSTVSFNTSSSSNINMLPDMGNTKITF